MIGVASSSNTDPCVLGLCRPFLLRYIYFMPQLLRDHEMHYSYRTSSLTVSDLRQHGPVQSEDRSEG